MNVTVVFILNERDLGIQYYIIIKKQTNKQTNKNSAYSLEWVIFLIAILSDSQTL